MDKIKLTGEASIELSQSPEVPKEIRDKAQAVRENLGKSIRKLVDIAQADISQLCREVEASNQALQHRTAPNDQARHRYVLPLDQKTADQLVEGAQLMRELKGMIDQAETGASVRLRADKVNALLGALICRMLDHDVPGDKPAEQEPVEKPDAYAYRSEYMPHGDQYRALEMTLQNDNGDIFNADLIVNVEEGTVRMAPKYGTHEVEPQPGYIPADLVALNTASAILRDVLHADGGYHKFIRFTVDEMEKIQSSFVKARRLLSWMLNRSAKSKKSERKAQDYQDASYAANALLMIDKKIRGEQE